MLATAFRDARHILKPKRSSSKRKNKKDKIYKMDKMYASQAGDHPYDEEEEEQVLLDMGEGLEDADNSPKPRKMQLGLKRRTHLTVEDAERVY